MDKEILVGSGGLLGTGGLTAPSNPPANLATFGQYRSLVYGQIDGKFANRSADLRMVCGSDTYEAAASAYRSNNSDDSALDSLMRVTGGVEVSFHVPGVASKRQDAVIAKGSHVGMIVPIWENLTLIADSVTLADEGQVKLTAIMLLQSEIVRADAFARVRVQVVA